MKKNPGILIALLLAAAWKPAADDWITIDHKGYSAHYTNSAAQDIPEYINLLDEGTKEVNSFFSSTFNKQFAAHIHPDRKSLDTQWKKD